MDSRAKAFVFAILLLGLCTLIQDDPAGSFNDPVRFGVYLAAALAAACMKVTLPGAQGTMSLLFLFALVGIVELNLEENLLIAAAAVVAQRYWKAKSRPNLLQLSFNVASILIAICLADYTYRSAFLQSLHLHLALSLCGAAAVFFVANTLPVASIISLTEGKSMRQVWQEFYFWSFPYYLVGAGVAGSFTYIKARSGWQMALLLIPVAVVVYRSYCLYMDKFEARKQHAEQLQAAAERVKSVLESTTDCVFAVDSEFRITYMNQRAMNRFSCDSAGSGVTFWHVFPDVEGNLCRQQFELALAEKRPVHFEQRFEAWNAWFEVHAYTSPEGLAIYFHDITERRELEEQLRHAHKMEAVGRLAGGVAHDFNNLLTVILGYSQVALDGMTERDSLRPYLDEIHRAGERAATLTQRLLTFTRKQVIEPEVIEINTIVSGMEGMLRRLIGEDILLSVELDPAAGWIRADRNQIEQIVMNLAVNARDAMPEGGQLVIETQCTRSILGPDGTGTMVPMTRLVVRDTGHGIDAETRARVFDPFFTTKGAGKGTGLGLFIVYGIVQQYSGRIFLDSEPGRGTIFTVCLPAVAPALENLPRQTAAIAPPAGRDRTILLVEDEDGVREYTHNVLTRAGFRVIATPSGSACLAAAKDLLPAASLLISDVVMPEMSGPELASRLLARKPSLKVLYVSGYPDHVWLRQGPINSTELNFLQKPFSPEQLIGKVHMVLREEQAAAKTA